VPAKDWRLRIMDILEAIRRIQTYTAGMNREALAADPKTLDAILRNLVVIGEAVRHIPDEITMRFTDVPWDRMRAMRNFLIHEYPSVDPNIVWDTTQIDLPPLVPLLQQVLALAGRPGD